MINDVVRRHKELETYLEKRELGTAAKRLIDFQRDFDADDAHLGQVTSLNYALTDLADDADARPETITRITQRTLDLMRQISPVEEIERRDRDREEEVLEDVAQLKREVHEKMRPHATQKVSDFAFVGRGITKAYKSRRVKFSLQPVDVTLRLGEITAVVGENGNGKTTLLKIIAGLHAADSGTLSYPLIAPDSDPIDWYAVKQGIAWISQELPKWHGNVLDNLRFSAAIHGVESEKNVNYVDMIIARLGLYKYSNATWKELSGGYKMRFSLAKALIRKPKLLVIDEPLANLDVNAQITFLDDLRHFAQSPRHPMAVILSSQHLHEVERIADNILFLQQGNPIYNGSVEDFGVTRAENIYEIACETPYDLLTTAVTNHDNQWQLEKNGYNYTIRTPAVISRNDVLQFIINNNIALTYFRDISKSTRKLFRRNDHA